MTVYGGRTFAILLWAGLIVSVVAFLGWILVGP
jgi:hypothetical protein